MAVKPIAVSYNLVSTNILILFIIRYIIPTYFSTDQISSIDKYKCREGVAELEMPQPVGRCHGISQCCSLKHCGMFLQQCCGKKNRGIARKIRVNASIDISVLCSGGHACRTAHNYYQSWGPAATRALPASLFSNFLKLLMNMSASFSALAFHS